MPVISIDGPQLSIDKKRQLVEELTSTASDITGIPEQAFVILIKENKAENVGVGGELLSEREH